jgi:hypothetical protein
MTINSHAVLRYAVASAIVFLMSIVASDLAMARAIASPPSLPTTPQAFADQLLALYPQPDSLADDPNWSRWHDDLYDPEFTRLMDENESFGPLVEGVVDLDYDPLCTCQTKAGFVRISSISTRLDGTAEIKARHCYPADNSGKTKIPETCSNADLIIKRIGGAWRLYDVLDPGSIRQRLVRHNACLRKAKTTKAANACLTP